MAAMVLEDDIMAPSEPKLANVNDCGVSKCHPYLDGVDMMR